MERWRHADFGRRFVLGLAGPSGSGKSTAAGLLEARGARVVHGDVLGRQALRDPDISAAVGRILGLDPRNRGALAARVFGNPAALRRLSELTWPYIGSRAEAQCRGGEGVFWVFDAAVLLEAGWNRFCDRVLVLDSPEELRFLRLRKSGLGENEALARIRAQEGLGRRPGADEVWANMGSPAELDEDLRRLLLRWGAGFERGRVLA